MSTRLSERMVKFLEAVGRAGAVPRVINDDPVKTIESAHRHGFIETWQDGVMTIRSEHSIGAFGRDPYTRTKYNVPVIRARLTPLGKTVLQENLKNRHW